MKSRMAPGRAGFTLIELLIVVAIIAILAAIAVPNFLEAQVRSKISRGLADMRSLRVALEAYCVDAQKYPPSWPYDNGVNPLLPRLWRLSTPVAYITSCPSDVFTNRWDPLIPGVMHPPYHYVSSTDERAWVESNYTTWALGAPCPEQIKWNIRGFGPNNQLDHGYPYDATNGTTSLGDICIWGP